MAGHITLNEARRIALAAQGLDRPRPGRVTAGHLRRTIQQLGLVQLDYVNVLIPAHYQIPFSRLGPYERSRFDEVVYRSREFTEQWAHEASIVPVASWPLLEHRRIAHQIRPSRFERLMKQHPDYLDHVLGEIRRRGPVGADALKAPAGSAKVLPGTWIGTVQRAALEAHFGRGTLAVTERRLNFSRVFDLAERVIPAEHFTRKIGHEESQRELLLLAARAHGVGTAGDLADYYRMPIGQARPRLAELVEAGKLQVVQVETWSEPAYLHPAARLPKSIEAVTLLSPFDPVVWHRPRVARLFNFDYRIEIFFPQPKRRWGYYVLPFLMGDQLVARVDLKADRAGRQLWVRAAFLESGADRGTVAPALADELRTVAAWLKLETVAVERRGNFAADLGKAIKSSNK